MKSAEELFNLTFELGGKTFEKAGYTLFWAFASLLLFSPLFLLLLIHAGGAVVAVSAVFQTLFLLASACAGVCNACCSGFTLFGRSEPKEEFGVSPGCMPIAVFFPPLGLLINAVSAVVYFAGTSICLAGAIIFKTCEVLSCAKYREERARQAAQEDNIRRAEADRQRREAAVQRERAARLEQERREAAAERLERERQERERANIRQQNQAKAHLAAHNLNGIQEAKIIKAEAEKQKIAVSKEAFNTAQQAYEKAQPAEKKSALQRFSATYGEYLKAKGPRDTHIERLIAEGKCAQRRNFEDKLTTNAKLHRALGAAAPGAAQLMREPPQQPPAAAAAAPPYPVAPPANDGDLPRMRLG